MRFSLLLYTLKNSYALTFPIPIRECGAYISLNLEQIESRTPMRQEEVLTRNQHFPTNRGSLPKQNTVLSCDA